MRSNSVVVISFSGIDGAGKSTQIEALQAHLLELGFRPTLYTFWDNVVVFSRFRERMSLAAFKGEKGIGSRDNPIKRRDKNVTSWHIIAIRLFLYLLDAYSLRVAISGSAYAGADFVIFDRYIYDELANLPMARLPMRLYVRLISHLVPKPDLAYIVDADPEAAHLRKPEYPLEFVRTNRDAYITLSRLIPGMTVLAPSSAEETSLKIKESVSKVGLRTDTEHLDFPTPCSAGPREANTPIA
jgi:thymidylate kinase